MRVKIEEIQDKGLELTEKVSAELLTSALEPSEGFKLVAPGALKVKFKKVAGRVFLTGNLQADLVAPCKRCLKDVALDEPVELTLTFNPRTEGEGGPRPKPTEGERPAKAINAKYRGKADDHGKGRDKGDTEAAGTFDPQLAEEETYTSKSIDLWPFVREQILLAAPPSPVCREECKGLCISCGQDLNLADCGHRQVVTDPRWEALKGIRVEAAKSEQQQPKQQPKQRKE